MNERICEVAELCKFVQGKPIKTILDVGAKGSEYLGLLRQVGLTVTGVDIEEDSSSKAEHYIAGNFLEANLETYDLITCVSTIEHIGVKSNPTENYREEQQKAFKKLTELGKYLFVTFPYGKPAVFPNQYANIDSDQLHIFLSILNGWKVEFICFYNPDPRDNHLSWRELDPLQARNVNLVSEFGVQCIGIIKAEKW